ncbi:hypothetical protein CEXT_199111 [Caerostris extrusa]|uniref:Uncharacterized protein n=1 Tax=Caerostris extrusa TaxID=172846 RepID=A0AAV4WU60_CAEEX|nr:hypothetical protein CEXT_199111 [Caerostris extrusa]
MRGGGRCIGRPCCCRRRYLGVMEHLRGTEQKEKENYSPLKKRIARNMTTYLPVELRVAAATTVPKKKKGVLDQQDLFIVNPIMQCRVSRSVSRRSKTS